MFSIRRRLLLVLAVGLVLLLGATSLVVARLLTEHATSEFDATLRAKARALVSLTEQEGGRIELDYDPAHMPEYEREADPEYFQFWLEDGRMLLRSHRLEGDLPRRASPTAEPAIRDALLPDGRPGRMVDLAFVPKGPEESADGEDANSDDGDEPGRPLGVMLAVARGRGSLDATLNLIFLAVFGGAAVAAVLAVLLVHQALVRGLRPVDAVAAQVSRLDAERLETPVHLARTPRELAPIVDQLNDLLKRLADSFGRERRFTGNVAHELRTPIAELRSLAEVGAAWPDDKEAIVRFFEDVHDIAERMDAMIGDLLLLARCEAGFETVERRPVPLRALVEASWERLAARAHDRGLSIRLEVPDDLVLETDPSKLGIIVANVVGNAVSYAHEGGTVACRGGHSVDRFHLVVANPADRLEEQDLERLAEPFWRKDTARASAVHAGLGLAVARGLADLLGLELRFDQNPDGIFRARLSGPLRPRPAESKVREAE